MLSSTWPGLRPTPGTTDGFAPACELAFSFLALHLRLEALLRLPVLRQLVARLPQIDRQAGKVGRAERRGLQHLRPHYRHAEEIGLELHQEIVGRRAAVDAQLGEPFARVLLHGFEQLRAL